MASSAAVCLLHAPPAIFLFACLSSWWCPVAAPTAGRIPSALILLRLFGGNGLWKCTVNGRDPLVKLVEASVFLSFFLSFFFLSFFLSFFLFSFFLSFFLSFFTTLLLYYFTTLLLYYFTTLLLYYFTTLLLYYFPSLLLYFIKIYTYFLFYFSI